MNQQDSDEIQHFYSCKKLPSICGSATFIDSIANRFDSFRQDKELAGIEILSVDAETVIVAVCDVCRVSKQELLTSRRGVANLPRDLAVYMLRSHSQQTLSEIGNSFGVNNYSTVSTIIERAKKILDKDQKVRKVHKRIGLKLKVSQQPT